MIKWIKSQFTTLSRKQLIVVVVTFPITSIGAIILLVIFKAYNKRVLFRSSVLEHQTDKLEVESSILSGTSKI